MLGCGYPLLLQTFAQSLCIENATHVHTPSKPQREAALGLFLAGTDAQTIIFLIEILEVQVQVV
jgi:hypothetical protein